jgi:hypothetical protein
VITNTEIYRDPAVEDGDFSSGNRYRFYSRMQYLIYTNARLVAVNVRVCACVSVAVVCREREGKKHHKGEVDAVINSSGKRIKRLRH